MAVNPLDLQVNLANINQIGKKQTLAKESEVLRQDQASEQIKKEGQQNAKEVPKTKDLEDGSGKIKKDKEKSSKQQGKKDEDVQQKAVDEKDLDDKTEKEMKDPTIGQNIDILG